MTKTPFYAPYLTIAYFTKDRFEIDLEAMTCIQRARGR